MRERAKSGARTKLFLSSPHFSRALSSLDDLLGGKEETRSLSFLVKGFCSRSLFFVGFNSVQNTKVIQ